MPLSFVGPRKILIFVKFGPKLIMLEMHEFGLNKSLGMKSVQIQFNKAC